MSGVAVTVNSKRLWRTYRDQYDTADHGRSNREFKEIVAADIPGIFYCKSLVAVTVNSKRLWRTVFWFLSASASRRSNREFKEIVAGGIPQHRPDDERSQ